MRKILPIAILTAASFVTPIFPVYADVYYSGQNADRHPLYCERIPDDVLFNTMQEPMGDMGRLVVPDLHVDVQLCYTPCGDPADVDYYQMLCDMQDVAICQDYAAVFDEDTQPLIADHWNQGFGELKNAVEGETEAYIVTADGEVQNYVCTMTGFGYNDEISIYDEDWQQAALQNTDGICMYTCNGSWQNVILTYWQPASATK